jgi:hypothetical protein
MPAGLSQEGVFALPASLFTAVIDTGTLPLTGILRSIYIVVTTPLVYTTTAPTARMYASRVPFAAAGGATSQLTVNQQLMGAAALTLVGLNPALTVTATGMPNGTYIISPASAGFADLQWPHPYIGLELVFGAAVSAGVFQIFLESGGV